MSEHFWNLSDDLELIFCKQVDAIHWEKSGKFQEYILDETYLFVRSSEKYDCCKCKFHLDVTDYSKMFVYAEGEIMFNASLSVFILCIIYYAREKWRKSLVKISSNFWDHGFESSWDTFFYLYLWKILYHIMWNIQTSILSIILHVLFYSFLLYYVYEWMKIWIWIKLHNLSRASRVSRFFKILKIKSWLLKVSSGHQSSLFHFFVTYIGDTYMSFLLLLLWDVF